MSLNIFYIYIIWKEDAFFHSNELNIHDGIYNEIKKEKFLNVRNRKQQKYLAKYWIKIKIMKLFLTHKSLKWGKIGKKFKMKQCKINVDIQIDQQLY